MWHRVRVITRWNSVPDSLTDILALEGLESLQKPRHFLKQAVPEEKNLLEAININELENDIQEWVKSNHTLWKA